MPSENSFGARATLRVGDRRIRDLRLDALQAKYDVARLPFSLKVLLENLLRNEDGVAVRAEDVEALARWDAAAEPPRDRLHARPRAHAGLHRRARRRRPRRDARRDGRLGGDPAKINPLVPAELVIDHSVQVDEFGTRGRVPSQRRAGVRAQPGALRVPALGPGRVRRLQGRAARHRHRPPGQPRVPRAGRLRRRRRPVRPTPTRWSAPTRTPRWSTASACWAGASAGSRPRRRCSASRCRCSIPQVVGFKLSGELPEGATATDLVLTVTEMLRKHGVVGKFVEFYGPGAAQPAARRPGDHRQHVAGVRLDVRDLPDRRRDAALPGVHRPLHGADRAGRGLREGAGPVARREQRGADVLRDARAGPGRRRAPLAGPKRPQDRVSLTDAKAAFRDGPRRATCAETRNGYDEAVAESFPASRPARPTAPGARPSRRAASRGAGTSARGRRARRRAVRVTLADGDEFELDHGARRDRRDHELHEHVEPVGDGRRRPARAQRGRAGPERRKPWVKTSLAPGSQVVTEYLERAGLTEHLEALGFHLVGYGCTTCIGNSGPLPDEISAAVDEGDLASCSVLSATATSRAASTPT